MCYAAEHQFSYGHCDDDIEYRGIQPRLPRSQEASEDTAKPDKLSLKELSPNEFTQTEDFDYIPPLPKFSLPPPPQPLLQWLERRIQQQRLTAQFPDDNRTPSITNRSRRV